MTQPAPDSRRWHPLAGDRRRPDRGLGTGRQPRRLRGSTRVLELTSRPSSRALWIPTSTLGAMRWRGNRSTWTRRPPSRWFVKAPGRGERPKPGLGAGTRLGSQSLGTSAGREDLDAVGKPKGGAGESGRACALAELGGAGGGRDHTGNTGPWGGDRTRRKASRPGCLGDCPDLVRAHIPAPTTPARRFGRRSGPAAAAADRHSQLGGPRRAAPSRRSRPGAN